MPTDPAKVTRAHVIDWMRFLQRPGADGGQGLAAQTALQRFRSVSRLFAWMVDTDENLDPDGAVNMDELTRNDATRIGEVEPFTFKACEQQVC